MAAFYTPDINLERTLCRAVLSFWLVGLRTVKAVRRANIQFRAFNVRIISYGWSLTN